MALGESEFTDTHWAQCFELQGKLVHMALTCTFTSILLHTLCAAASPPSDHQAQEDLPDHLSCGGQRRQQPPWRRAAAAAAPLAAAAVAGAGATHAADALCRRAGACAVLFCFSSSCSALCSCLHSLASLALQTSAEVERRCVGCVRAQPAQLQLAPNAARRYQWPCPPPTTTT